MTIKFLFLLTFCLVFSVIFAQTSDDKEALKRYRQANSYFRKGDYRDAIPLYESVQELYSAEAEYNYRLGICYLHSYAQPKDLEFLERTVTIDKKVDRDIYYWLGRSNHLNYNFEKAGIYYTKHKERLRVYEKSQIKLIDNFIEQVKYAKYLCEIPQTYIVEQVEGEINTLYSEHSPVTTMDGSMLIYTSRHPNEVNNDEKDEVGEFLEKMYITYKLDSGKWETPVLLNIDPTFKNHLASMQLIDDGSKMLLYKSTHQGDVYISNKIDKYTWSEPLPYSTINSIDFEADVYLARDEKSIFVSTDRFNKDGNLDIYVSEKQIDGSWGEFVSLGNAINTPFDENSPFLSNDGKTLFFSSNGHKSMGGYDVFKAERADPSSPWSAPVNMGYPINTPDDDVYFYFGYNGWTGYTSSYRTGGVGEKDIYKITFVPNVNIAGKVYSGETKEIEPDVKICFVAINQPDSTMECDLSEGDSTFNVNILSNSVYKVLFTKGEEVLDTQYYAVPFLVEGDPVFYKNDFYLYKEPDTAKTDTAQNPPLLAGNLEEPEELTPLIPKKIEPYSGPKRAANDILEIDENGELEHIRNIYFPFDSYKFDNIFIEPLDKVVKYLTESDKIIITVSGHADDKGLSSYNQKLSYLRAYEVRKYLLSKGVAEDRIIVKQFGSTQPMVSNDDESDGRELNRRVEFKVFRQVD